MKILMVCLGNICRSPMAEGIFRKLTKERNLSFEVDSAGTGNWHAGENPDKRAIATARKEGVDISKLVARQFIASDFETFDRIYVMDQSNYRDVIRLARNEQERNKVDLLLHAISPGTNMEVPDPWYGGMDGFDEVYRMMHEACETILDSLEQKR